MDYVKFATILPSISTTEWIKCSIRNLPSDPQKNRKALSLNHITTHKSVETDKNKHGVYHVLQKIPYLGHGPTLTQIRDHLIMS